MKKQVLVMGGGVIGLCSAIAMQQRGHLVRILANPIPERVGPSRLYALNQASIDLLTHLDVWSKLTRRSVYDKMRVWDAKGSAQIDFDARMVACNKLGVMVLEDDLHKIVSQRVSDLGIEIMPHDEIKSIISHDQTITLSDGQTHWSADLLMIADGPRSKARECLRVSMTTWSYHQKAIVVEVHTEQTHQRTAYQVFHAEGPLALLPLEDNQGCSVVWSVTQDKAEWLLTLSELEFEHELNQAFGPGLGKITLTSPRNAFPLHMRHVNHYAGQHWLILGDAAHTIHPLAGLGLNLGLADLAFWLSVSKSHVSNKTLQTYQRGRKHALWKTILFLQLIHTVFTQTQLPWVKLRNFGLNWFNRVSYIKRLLIEHAMGEKNQRF